jgi:hypothetical protein
MTKKMYENSLREGKAVRPMKFMLMDEANHFVSHKDGFLLLTELISNVRFIPIPLKIFSRLSFIVFAKDNIF